MIRPGGGPDQTAGQNSAFGPRLILGVAVVLAVVAATLIATAGSTSANGATAVQAINNHDRLSVARTYRAAIEDNLHLLSNWTGSTSACNPGSASASFDNGTVEAINWFRVMAGLSNVTEDPSQSSDAQRAALMMDAQNYLSHSPSSAWSCYSAAGAEAAQRSNLTLGTSGASGVLGQIQDLGAANVHLGHRRWLLYPRLETVGIGNTASASAVQVINNFGNPSAERNWVQWPPAGFVPDDVVFERWSVSYAGAAEADYTNARVSVSENGRNLGVSLLPLADGFGDATLGFEVAGANPTTIGDTVYRVSITGIRLNGRSIEHNYTVTAFDARAAAFSCNGRPATILGTIGADTITGTVGNDVIVALGGNDSIDGRTGNDIICAGRGNDTIDGSWGNDVLIGAGGADVLVGGTGHDTLRGGPGSDQLQGRSGNDVVNGGNGTDTCWGESGYSDSVSGDNHQCEQGR